MLIVDGAAARVIKVKVNSGTGFFVHPQGYLVTNLHVVSQCGRIRLHGQGEAMQARIIGRDATHDLALLKAEKRAGAYGEFRSAELPAVKGERVLTIGYPGSAAKELKLVTREARITNPRGPRGESKWLQLSDVVEEGNSGGPLLDGAGNVLGVIMAKAIIYTYPKSQPDSGVYTHSGVAIAAPVVTAFIASHGVGYDTSDADSALSAERISDEAAHYIMNVRCETTTEVR